MDFLTPFSKYVVAPAYSIKEKSKLFSHLRKVEQCQWLPIEELKRLQFAKLKKIIIHANETVDFYRERFKSVGFDPYKFKSIDQIQKIPLLTKENIVENKEKLISAKYKIQELVPSCTGGSTGIQLHFYIDRESVNKKNACAWRHNRWANWDIGSPVASLWGNPPIANTLKKKIRSKILNRYTYLDTIDMNANSMDKFLKKLNKLKKYVLYGHSHSQYLLAKYLKDNKVKVKKAEGIISTSMMLMENERKLIEEVFVQKVTDRYGCEEVSLIGSECEKHSGMHLNIDHLYIEFVKDDMQIAKEGEEGRVVVTDLTNFGMPFIRYEVGDIAIPSNRRCDCGRELPMIKAVIGRTADFLYKKDGSKVAGVSLIERWLTNIPGIYQMQIVQNDYEEININIVKGREFNELNTIQALRDQFKKVFHDATMKIRYYKKIPQERSGKYRFSICNIKQ